MRMCGDPHQSWRYIRQILNSRGVGIYVYPRAIFRACGLILVLSFLAEYLFESETLRRSSRGLSPEGVEDPTALLRESVINGKLAYAIMSYSRSLQTKERS